jgi:hypothetical protein
LSQLGAAAEEVETRLAFVGGGTQERRLMLAARIEQEASPRLDDRAEPMTFEQAADSFRFASPVRIERRQDAVIDGQTDAPVAEVGEDR